VCENNLYGASTHVSKITRKRSIVERTSGYGIPAQTVDGNDVLAVYEAARSAAAACRAGRGPFLLELLTYRTTGHSRRDTCQYQPKDEREAWAQRDPLLVMEGRLASRDDIRPADLETVRARVRQQIQDAIEAARREPEPVLADLTTDVYV
jgi:pyruvate dehydrogenase E1 component alpha subunit